MSTEVKMNVELEKLRIELTQAVGAFPFQPKNVPIEFRQKIVATMNSGVSPRELGLALGINNSNFYQWKKDLQNVGMMKEVKISSVSSPKTATKITISDSKKQLIIEGLSFEEILLVLKERFS